MYPVGTGVLFFVICLYLCVLTYLIFRQRNFFSKLFPEVDGKVKNQLIEILKEVRSLDEFKKESFSHMQKIALKRYNPYKDTGGDQSFSVALLNGRGDGVVITSLHARAATRVFAKSVKLGHETGIEFSEEEKQVIKKALGS